MIFLKVIGLTIDSGIGVGGIRWISKNRILNRSGKVTNPIILEKVDEYLLNSLFFYKVLSAHHDNEIFDLKRKQSALKAELSDVKSVFKSVEELLLNHSPELLESFKEVAASKNLENF